MAWRSDRPVTRGCRRYLVHRLKQLSRAAVVAGQALPEDTSAQKEELITHTKTLELRKGKRLNIYMDSRYAFATAHVHEAIYQQKSLLMSGRKEIKNKEEILALLRTSTTLPR